MSSGSWQEMPDLYRGYMGVSQNLGYLIGGPYNKDYNILGSILGSPYFVKLPNRDTGKENGNRYSAGFRV